MSFNGRFVVNLIHFANKQGVASEELIACTGKSEQELMAEDCVVDDDVYNRVIERTVELTKDKFFGLHAGENLNLSAAGLIMQLAQTSDTIKRALELSCEFANLGCNALPLALVEHPDYYKVQLSPDPIWSVKSFIALKHTINGLIAFTIRQFHSLTQMKHYPIKIHVNWKCEENIAEYQRVFCCPVYFEQNEVAIFLTKRLVEEKILTSDFQLQKILLQYAEEKSGHLKQEKGFAAIVKESVVLLIQPNFPTIDEVAGHLNMSARSLQRRLRAEGEHYKSLVETLKKEFALRYLKRHDLNIGEVAYLLGYADVSSFTRAFKKWMGKPPSAYRPPLKSS